MFIRMVVVNGKWLRNTIGIVGVKLAAALKLKHILKFLYKYKIFNVYIYEI